MSVSALIKETFLLKWILKVFLACEQTLRGALEEEGEVATTSLEGEYLYRKSRFEMLIGRDDINNDVITLAKYFSVFVYTGARFRFALIGGNLTAQSTGSHSRIGGGIQIPATYLQALLPFSRPVARAPWTACSQAKVFRSRKDSNSVTLYD